MYEEGTVVRIAVELISIVWLVATFIRVIILFVCMLHRDSFKWLLPVN